jgi:carbamoyl-phosphate synthase/aspartate carbamoyltransferase
VGIYSNDYSHYLADSSLSEWLIENNIPAIYNIDTRALVKKIRNQGSILAKLASFSNEPSSQESRKILDSLEWHDPNSVDLVQQVSRKSTQVFTPANPILGPNGKPLVILAVDVGMKNNQIRCFVNRGITLKVVSYDYDFIKDSNYDGLFISNGPGTFLK